MEWRWGRGHGETHEGAVVQRNRAMALGFGVEFPRRCFGVPVAVRAEEGGEMRNGTATRWAGTGVASGRGCDARTSTARGLRAQVSGDGWRHVASRL